MLVSKNNIPPSLCHALRFRGARTSQQRTSASELCYLLPFPRFPWGLEKRFSEHLRRCCFWWAKVKSEQHRYYYSSIDTLKPRRLETKHCRCFAFAEQRLAVLHLDSCSLPSFCRGDIPASSVRLCTCQSEKHFVFAIVVVVVVDERMEEKCSKSLICCYCYSSLRCSNLTKKSSFFVEKMLWSEISLLLFVELR